MSNPEPLQLAHCVYGLADQLVQLRFFAACNWVEATEGDPVPGIVDEHVGRASALAKDLESQLHPEQTSSTLTSLREAVERAGQQFTKAWMSKRHREDIDCMQHGEPEGTYEGRKSLLQDSPLAEEAWQDIKVLGLQLASALPSPLSDMFQLSTCLAEELPHTEAFVSFPVSEATSEERHIKVDLARQVKKLMTTLARSCPSLKGLDSDLSKGSIRQVRDKIDSLHTEIMRRLDAQFHCAPQENEDPKTTPRPEEPLPRFSATPAPGNVPLAQTPKSPLTASERERLLKLKNKIDPSNSYIGESDAILRVFQLIVELNKMPDEPVVVLGPSGAGKTEIAELIHKSSPRSKAKFVRDQAALNEASDGAVRTGRWAGFGAKTGLPDLAQGAKGLLEECAGGTIFIDEMGDLDPKFQLFLFDVLDRKKIPKAAGVGDPVEANVRLIFATNRDLGELERTGRLRYDFLRRIKQFTVSIPPLDKRKEDLFHFVRLKCPDRKPTPRFLLCLLLHDWTGEVRELLQILKLVTSGKKNGEKLSIEHVEVQLPDATARVRELSDDKAEGEVYQALARMLRQQGLKEGRGLYRRMADFLAVHPATVGRKAKKYLSEHE